MKYLSTEEYIFDVTNLIKKQNRRIKVRLDNEADERRFSRVKVDEVMKKFDMINKYVGTEIMNSVNNIKGNDRYIFQFVDDYVVSASGRDAKYFKIIIKNKITNMENFIVTTYDMFDFFLKVKTPNSENNTDVINYDFPVEKFTKGKFRKIFFEYLLEILKLDTMPFTRRIIPEEELLLEEQRLLEEKEQEKKLLEERLAEKEKLAEQEKLAEEEKEKLAEQEKLAGQEKESSDSKDSEKK